MNNNKNHHWPIYLSIVGAMMPLIFSVASSGTKNPPMPSDSPGSEQTLIIVEPNHGLSSPGFKALKYNSSSNSVVIPANPKDTSAMNSETIGQTVGSVPTTTPVETK